MTLASLAILSTIALIVDFQPGGVTVDKGLIDGLRPGDEGVVFYLLSNGTQEFRFESGIARVDRCEDRTCQARTTPLLKASPGYLVDFQVAEDRRGFESLSELFRQRIAARRLEAAALYLDELRALADSPDRVRELATLDRLLEEKRRPTQAPPPIVPELQAFREAVARGNLNDAERLLSVLRNGALAPEQLDSAEESMTRLLSQTMLMVPAQTATFGLNHEEAVDYNQTPAFQTPMAAFWIDRRPVSRPGAPQEAHRGMSYADADQYCRDRGERLPTEFEWALAARRPGFVSAPRLSEWTSSWYLPYPGNSVPEPGYGGNFKVVRGHDEKGRFTPERRFYLAVSDVDRDVGFRCVREVN